MAAVAAGGCGPRVPPASPAPLMRTEPIPPPRPGQPHDQFGRLFCGVLAHLPEQGGRRWNACETYYEPAGAAAPLGDLTVGIRFRVLLVPGIFGQCVEALASPFADAKRHLWDEHRLPVEYVSVTGLGSTTYNARQIVEYLRDHFSGQDQRPYIVFGYSKGASDVLEALRDADTGTRIRALVTVSGTVLGSRLPEGIPRDLLSDLQRSRLATCEVGDGGGIDSLRRPVRVGAMTRFTPPPRFRAYSIAAVSTETTTSAALYSGWRQLRAYSREQDSQVVHEDALVPGGVYLGYAKGDHWAVALPFEDVPDDHPLARVVARAVNRNHYPRAALVEAALRYVDHDLP